MSVFWYMGLVIKIPAGPSSLFQTAVQLEVPIAWKQSAAQQPYNLLHFPTFPFTTPLDCAHSACMK